VIISNSWAEKPAYSSGQICWWHTDHDGQSSLYHVTSWPLTTWPVTCRWRAPTFPWCIATLAAAWPAESDATGSLPSQYSAVCHCSLPCHYVYLASRYLCIGYSLFCNEHTHSSIMTSCQLITRHTAPHQLISRNDSLQTVVIVQIAEITRVFQFPEIDSQVKCQQLLSTIFWVIFHSFTFILLYQEKVCNITIQTETLWQRDKER